MLGRTALARHALDTLLRAAHAGAALPLAAVSGSPEAYAAPVHAVRPYPARPAPAAEVRRLLGPAERPYDGGRRIQDPYGFRAFPQVRGCALDAAGSLRGILETEIDCPSANPLIAPDGTAAFHHGGFCAAPLALALDALDLAVLQTAQLSAARLTALGRPDLTGLPAFLATGPAGCSGTMILDYPAASALAEPRTCATPASAGHAVLSHGLGGRESRLPGRPPAPIARSWPANWPPPYALCGCTPRRPPYAPSPSRPRPCPPAPTTAP